MLWGGFGKGSGHPEVRAAPLEMGLNSHIPCWIQRGTKRGAGGSRGSPVWGREQTLRLGIEHKQLL